MAIAIMLVAAVFASLQNFFMRRSVDSGASVAAYIPTQLFVSFIITILLNPIRSGNFAFDPTGSALGFGMGLLLGVMMWSLGQSMKYGSASLTIAFLNSSSVLPAIGMAALFGGSLGHPYHWWTAVGAVLVVLGIFWGSWKSENYANKTLWVIFAMLATGTYFLFNISTQWRVLLETHGGQGIPFLPIALDGSVQSWFMPSIFAGATLFQVFVLLKNKDYSFNKQTLKYGLLGGISNGSSMFCIITATQVATGFENAMLFPVFSIAIIQICNAWGKALYQEKIQVLANAMCVLGIIVGTVNWTHLCNMS